MVREQIYKFKDGRRKYKIKANNEQEAWEKLAKQLGYDEVDNFYDDQNVDLYPIQILNSGDPLDYRNQIGMSASKSDCEQMGGAWVKGYTKHINGRIVRVDGYCREQQSIYHY